MDSPPERLPINSFALLPGPGFTLVERRAKNSYGNVIVSEEDVRGSSVLPSLAFPFSAEQ